MRKAHRMPYTLERNWLLLDFDGVLVPYDVNFVETWIRSGLHPISREVAESRPLEGESLNARAEEMTANALKHLAGSAAKDLMASRANAVTNFIKRATGQADKVAKYTRKEHHDDYYAQFGIDRPQMLQKVRENMLKDKNYLKKELPKLHDAIRRSRQHGLNIVIVSHSDRATIRERLIRLGLSDLFKDEDILGTHELQGHEKSKGPEAYRLVLDTLKITAQQARTLDDSSGNLEQAGKLGIECIKVPKQVFSRAIHTIKSPSRSTVHYHANALEFFDMFNRDIEQPGRAQPEPSGHSGRSRA